MKVEFAKNKEQKVWFSEWNIFWMELTVVLSIKHQEKTVGT